MSNNKDEAKWGLIGLGIGVVSGVVAGMLLAPKSGKETRSDIVKKANDTKQAAADQVSKATSSLKNVAKKSEEQVSKAASSVKKAAKKADK